MAIAAVVETARGTGLSGKYGESFTFTRKWLIRVDSPSTSRVLISRAAGVTFGQGHPDFADHLAMEFDLTEESGDGMMWGLTVKYYIPPKDNTPDAATGMPKDVWSASGSTSSIPVYEDKDGIKIVNSANDPLEGGERESSDFGLSLTKCYADLAWSNLARTHSNTVNSATWNSSPARTWKVAFRSANKKEATVSANDGSATKVFWEVSWEFSYREATWNWKPWDVGFNQRVDSAGAPSSSGSLRAAVLGGDKKPVKAPVALANGVAKAVGEKPDALDFKLYKEQPFSVFGDPS